MSHPMLIEVERRSANKLAACGYGASIHHPPRKTIKAVNLLRRNVRYSRGKREFPLVKFTTEPSVLLKVREAPKCL